MSTPDPAAEKKARAVLDALSKTVPGPECSDADQAAWLERRATAYATVARLLPGDAAFADLARSSRQEARQFRN